MSTHNLCFGAKIRKIVYPCIPQFYYIKVGYDGVFISQTCYPDEQLVKMPIYNVVYMIGLVNLENTEYFIIYMASVIYLGRVVGNQKSKQTCCLPHYMYIFTCI